MRVHLSNSGMRLSKASDIPCVHSLCFLVRSTRYDQPVHPMGNDCYEFLADNMEKHGVLSIYNHSTILTII